jgi:hypothetical protein
MSDMNKLFEALITATTAAQIRTALAEVGDTADLDIRTPFGPLNLRWEPYGDNLSNISSVGLGTKPGKSLTERLTNAIDPVLEDRATYAVTLPQSSRLAAQQWFGRPVTGPDDGLYKWSFDGSKYDRLMHVVLLPSGVDTAPTVDVLDNGVGISNDRFRGTILSLQAGNKLTKRYLIGAFGQGGAATLAFCQFALIVSRPHQDANQIAFTVVRVMRLSDDYKEDAYAYLAHEKNGRMAVPVITHTGPLNLYAASGKVKNAPVLEHGTLVRHIEYKLPNLSGTLSPSPGNLYQHLHNTMFDPLLPFRAIDLRDEARARDERITGSRNRLMRLVEQKDEESEGRVEIRHHRPMEYFSLSPGDVASTGIEYWVVNHYRKSKKGGKDELVLRSNSIDSFVAPAYPIIGTLNGQTQGELTGRLLKQLGLGMTARHIVVHVDASNTTPRLRRELFSTNREGFKEGDVLSELERILTHMFEEDEELKKIEQELTDRLTKRDTDETNKEVNNQITRLLREAGFQIKATGAVDVPGNEDTTTVERKKRPKYVKPDPLPTLPYPNVTKFTIVSPQPTLEVALGDHEIVLVETDADAQFDKAGRIAIRTEPKHLEEFGKSPLKGGRIRWRLRPVESAVANQSGKVIATITRLDGSQLTDEVPYLILPQRESRSRPEQGLVPPFKILPVSPDEEETWSSLWPNLGDGSDPEAQAGVAYKPLNVNGEIHVYYSTIFSLYRHTLDNLKTQGESLAQFFDNSYQVWIGYHAILQESAKREYEVDLDLEKLESVLDSDRTRVAQMQVKQALQTARLQYDLLKVRSQAEAADVV